MNISNIPFGTTDWSEVERTEHPGITGKAFWRTQQFGGIRVRMVEYTAGYVSRACSHCFYKCERGENSANQGARRRPDWVSGLGVQRRVALFSPRSLRVAAKKAMRSVAKPYRGDTPVAFRASRMAFLTRNASCKNNGNRPRHWCSKGHILLCLEGELHTELDSGRQHVLLPGMSYQVADGAEAHRSTAPNGAKLFIVD